jgi:bacillithiol biosynthesis cysteine-adding enzyme BshC
MQMEVLKWQGNQPLAEDYIDQSEQAAHLFDSHFANPEDWLQRAAFLDEFQDRANKADREQLVTALIAYNNKAGNSPLALQNARELLDASALVVVGGQQAGLFGGPLLVIYKAITIIQLAREWSRKLQRPVIPVFWIAGEDHDFDEANHMYYLSGQLQVEKVKVEHPTGRRTSVSKLPLTEEAWERALEALEASLIDTEFKQALLDKVRFLTNGGRTLTDSFAAWMASLFGEYGLVLLDSDDPALRHVEAAMFQQLIERNEEVGEALAQGKRQVEAAGYQAQADVTDNGANLFVFQGDQRLLLQRDAKLFTDKKKDYTFSREQLIDMAVTSPERLSNNVMTRPLMQEFLFPVLATVLGPGEIAYWAITRQAFHLFGMKMPIVAPRLEFTLVEGSVLKYMGKYGLTFDDIRFRFEDKQREWLEAQDKLKLSEQFDAVKASFQDIYAPLVESLGAINAGVQNLGDTNLARIIEQIEYLEGKASDAYKAQFDAALRQLERIRLSILPLAKPQERVYNVFAYLNRYGEDWIKQLTETQLPVDGMHRVYYL